MGPLQNDVVRARLADTIPSKHRVQTSSDKVCTMCGLNTTMKRILNSNDAAGGHLILIKRLNNDDLNINDEQNIREYLKNNKVKFSTVMINDGSKTPHPFYDEISRLSGGLTSVFSPYRYRCRIVFKSYYLLSRNTPTR